MHASFRHLAIDDNEHSVLFQLRDTFVPLGEMLNNSLELLYVELLETDYVEPIVVGNVLSRLLFSMFCSLSFKHPLFCLLIDDCGRLGAVLVAVMLNLHDVFKRSLTHLTLPWLRRGVLPV